MQSVESDVWHSPPDLFVFLLSRIAYSVIISCMHACICTHAKKNKMFRTSKICQRIEKHIYIPLSLTGQSIEKIGAFSPTGAATPPSRRRRRRRSASRRGNPIPRTPRTRIPPSSRQVRKFGIIPQLLLEQLVLKHPSQLFVGHHLPHSAGSHRRCDRIR